jgi:Flp pilus assembly protein TadG
MFATLFTFSVFVLAGLVIDGGLAIHARQRAFDMAEQAARAAANDIDENKLRTTGVAEINLPNGDQSEACGKAVTLLMAYREQNMTYQCLPFTPKQATVSVTITVDSKILGLIPGLRTFTMTGTASAHPDQGN